jgi:hypothetical protein
VRAILAEAVGQQGQQQRADVVEVPVDELSGDAGLRRDGGATATSRCSTAPDSRT